MLLAATSVALVWANSPWAAAYEALWHTPLTVGAGTLVLTIYLHHWINDGILAASVVSGLGGWLLLRSGALPPRIAEREWPPAESGAPPPHPS